MLEIAVNPQRCTVQVDMDCIGCDEGRGIVDIAETARERK